MAAHGPKQPLRAWRFELTPLGENDIEMRVSWPSPQRRRSG
jgi:hypothetical protein